MVGHNSQEQLFTCHCLMLIVCKAWVYDWHTTLLTVPISGLDSSHLSLGPSLCNPAHSAYVYKTLTSQGSACFHNSTFASSESHATQLIVCPAAPYHLPGLSSNFSKPTLTCRSTLASKLDPASSSVTVTEVSDKISYCIISGLLTSLILRLTSFTWCDRPPTHLVCPGQPAATPKIGPGAVCRCDFHTSPHLGCKAHQGIKLNYAQQCFIQMPCRQLLSYFG